MKICKSKWKYPVSLSSVYVCECVCTRISCRPILYISEKYRFVFLGRNKHKKRCRVCVSFRVFLFDNIFLKNIWQNNHFVFDPFNFPYVFWWFSRQKNVWIVFFKFLIYGRVTCKTFLHCSQKKPRTTLILGPICSSIYLWRPLRLRVSSFSSRKQQIIVYISMLRHQSVNIKPVYILWTKKQTHTLHTHTTHTRLLLLWNQIMHQHVVYTSTRYRNCNKNHLQPKFKLSNGLPPSQKINKYTVHLYKKNSKSLHLKRKIFIGCEVIGPSVGAFQ